MAPKGYPDDLTYLDAALGVVRLRARLRILEREAAGIIPRDAVTVISEGAPDPDAVREALAKASKKHAAQVKASAQLPRLLELQQRFKLDDFERDVLLLALAPAIDGAFNNLFGRVKGQSYRAPLDVDAALTLLLESFAERVAKRQAFTARGRLLSNNLLMVGRGYTESSDAFLSMELTLPARLVTLLLGQDGEDETLQSFSRLLEPKESLERVILPPDDKLRIVQLIALHDHYLSALQRWGLTDAIPYGRGVTMLFSGPPGTGKTLTARAVAAHLSRRLLLVDTGRLLGNDSGFEQNLDNLMREARLQNAVLFFDECESLFAAQNRFGATLPLLLQALEHFEGICILATNLPQTLDHALDRRILYRVNFDLPPPTYREAIWRVHLPDTVPLAPDVDLAYLGRRFEFSGGYIKNCVLLAAGVAATRAAQGAPEVISQADLLDACQTQLRHRLAQYADREVADLRIGDLILPDDVKRQVQEVIDAVSAQSTVFREWGFAKKFNKGRGLSALFDGDPGTGKTLSAEVIAAELGLGLFRVNVANIVSKYIGETEKNLTRVFGEARGAQAVLLFDEADSLFAKRVEVKGSNDRFANMETNVLLQLIERYDGLVILTTNLKSSIDTAFERRLSFKINFPFPEAEMRAAIWEHMLPPSAPLGDDVDHYELGRCFELSGGSIKNAVLRAAYRAASTGETMTMDHFADAAKRECQAAGKLFREPRRDDIWG